MMDVPVPEEADVVPELYPWAVPAAGMKMKKTALSA
jgi:hypothetical protein